MHKHLPTTIILSLAGWLAVMPLAHADDSNFDIESRFRAKIEKEKVKEAYLQRQAQQTGNQSTPASSCGSQSIGNVNTGGSIGTTPREVFVFAPNAINLVSGPGCH